MKKTIYNKFDKKLISSLPPVAFSGRIEVIISENEANKAVDYLLSQDLLGIDTETRPSFRRGEQHKVSLLQVCDDNICFLFRLNYIGMSGSIIRLLEDKTVKKIGLSLHDDMMMLHRRAAFDAGLFVDLQDLVGEIGIEDLSLQKLYANIFGKRIIKRQQLSNWENAVLTEKQKLYAATDAWTCIQLYKELVQMKETKDYELVIVDDTASELACSNQ